MIYLTATDFSFITDQDARDYLADITEVMMRCFGITREEALGRINDSWSHVPEVVGEDDWMYRELPEYWANHFYYGKESYWWLAEERQAENGLAPLAPLPHPRE